MKKIIRNALLSDYSDIDCFMKELHNIHVKNRPDMYAKTEHVYSLEEYKKILNEKNMEVLVCVISEKIVGMCVITYKNSTQNPIMVSTPIAYIEDIYVMEEYRLKGIGKELYECVREKAKMRGCKRIELMVWEFNSSAKEFYCKNGMTVQRSFLEDIL